MRFSVVICSSCTAADEGLSREVYGLQPRCLLGVFPAGSQGQGNFPAVWAAPGHDHISHNAQNFQHLIPHPHPTPLSLPVLSSAVSLKPRSSLSRLGLSPFPISFPSPPLSLPSGDTPTHWWKPLAFDLWCTRHFLSRLWRPVLCPINAAVTFFCSSRLK